MQLLAFIVLFLLAQMLLVLPLQAKQESRKPLTNDSKGQFIPIALRYAGIGNIYGLGYANSYTSEHKFLLGGVSGDVVALGGRYVYQMAKPNSAQYELMIGHVAEMNALTYFSRGTAIDQQSQGYGQRVSLHALSLNKRVMWGDFKWKWNVAFVTSQINGFSDERKNADIVTPNIHLTPFAQASLGVKVAKQYRLTNAQDAMQLAIDAQLRTPSAGYSGDTLMTVENDWSWQVFSKGTLRLNGFYSTVLAVAKKIPKQSDVRQAFGIDCNQLSEASNRQPCEAFENDIVSYITAHNNHGTARSLGGATYLPAYVQGRFRAANSAFLGLDYAHVVLDASWVPQLFLSQQVGFASDDPTHLTEHPQYSSSAGLQWWLSDIAVRAQYATGSEGGVFSLVISH